jgi:hypothetical protein
VSVTVISDFLFRDLLFFSRPFDWNSGCGMHMIAHVQPYLCALTALITFWH